MIKVAFLPWVRFGLVVFLASSSFSFSAEQSENGESDVSEFAAFRAAESAGYWTGRIFVWISNSDQSIGKEAIAAGQSPPAIPDRGDVNDELRQIRKAIADASPGWLSSVFGWILQFLAIVVGALVAYRVSYEQSVLVASQSAQDSQEAWSRLTSELGFKKEIEEARRLDRVMKNDAVREAVASGLRIHMNVIGQYSRIANTRIGLVGINADALLKTVSHFDLPQAPPGLWENLPTYTKAGGELLERAVIMSHLYELGRHFSLMGKLQIKSMMLGLERHGSDEVERKWLEIEKVAVGLKSELRSLFKLISDISE